MTESSTIVTIKKDGKLYRETPEGLVPVEITPMREMTDEEIHQAALSDPDNPPMTPEDWAKLKLVPRVRRLRRALHLTQEEFAARFHIPVGTLRDWEQGRVEPDKPARAYLKVIAYDAATVERALNAPRPARSEIPETEPQIA